MRIEQLASMTSARLSILSADATLRMAALALSGRGIGLAVICGDDGRAIGVLSKSDLVRCLAQPAPAGPPPLATLMSTPFTSCGPGDEVHAVWRIMAARELQNVPVLSDDGRPLGVLDIRDALNVLIEQEEVQEHLLIEYIAGVGYR